MKYEEVYLHGYETVSVARLALIRYFDFYNRRRPHSTLDGNTPDRYSRQVLERRVAALRLASFASTP